MNLKGKVAVVTGSGRGIGKSIALKLAKAGADVVISDINLEIAQATASEIESLGVKSIALKSNVANSADVEEFFKEVYTQMGKVDILVNNAGITKDTLIMKMSEDEWDAVISVNLKGVFNCTKAVYRNMMKQRSGKIVNIASVVGITGNAGQANYSASKAGVIGLTKTTARELASRGVNVNAVAPGFIATDMTDKLSDEVKEAVNKKIPFGEMGTPEDIANAVLFLASEEAKYITGQVLVVDGGMVM
ncbi:MAG: beta-ketoacyl-ACP reductase [Candidatus Margulisiibacteriota bacterium]|nr:MAG: 3-oxoacyl-[acyl-carrier-protein] reductase [Candidatus Margulisbacteria bacterium GWD2_39_127]OGI01560.1 MAG: 3-oxoacyl-[acyl-carrier-protein] reductase [Candidatus Margulisbacteria bacterium GWF2_38_17]OGI10001.1 MAG: 3-oxoacyl-[acyl-carrier-protein] reductase [Candidatus Margulisbacteria bacterium GWE2_39_32]PZM78256.1 MAG: beta-ketoacyl-ACP reductase [Candidatus Margulisiibacteriota bacterium]HAR61856.1 beta-ketoacyl-ACP reductase [Candidatus Margulisiibacteriota bacterium]